MTKKDIVKTISDELGLTQLKTKEIVQKTLDAIVKTLVEERRIELRNFGVFEVKVRAARKARNPRTGAKVEVQEKFVVTFKPGKEMEARVRELEAELLRQSELHSAEAQHLEAKPVEAKPLEARHAESNGHHRARSEPSSNGSNGQDGQVRHNREDEAVPQPAGSSV